MMSRILSPRRESLIAYVNGFLAAYPRLAIAAALPTFISGAIVMIDAAGYDFADFALPLATPIEALSASIIIGMLIAGFRAGSGSEVLSFMRETASFALMAILFFGGLWAADAFSRFLFEGHIERVGQVMTPTGVAIAVLSSAIAGIFITAAISISMVDRTRLSDWRALAEAALSAAAAYIVYMVLSTCAAYFVVIPIIGGAWDLLFWNGYGLMSRDGIRGSSALSLAVAIAFFVIPTTILRMIGLSIVSMLCYSWGWIVGRAHKPRILFGTR